MLYCCNELCKCAKFDAWSLVHADVDLGHVLFDRRVLTGLHRLWPTTGR